MTIVNQNITGKVVKVEQQTNTDGKFYWDLSVQLPIQSPSASGSVTSGGILLIKTILTDSPTNQPYNKGDDYASVIGI